MGFDVQGAAAGCVRFHGRASLPLAAFVASFFLPVLAAHAQSQRVSSPGDEYKKLIKVSEDIQPLGETPQSSAGKQAYTDALIEAIDRYQNAVREHKNDDPRSRWLVWPGEGYRLEARLARTIATGRQLILISGGTTWAFDLSGVPVLNAKIAAEAAGSHSDE